jgi:hypothetical protein
MGAYRGRLGLANGNEGGLHRVDGGLPSPLSRSSAVDKLMESAKNNRTQVGGGVEKDSPQSPETRQPLQISVNSDDRFAGLQIRAYPIAEISTIHSSNSAFPIVVKLDIDHPFLSRGSLVGTQYLEAIHHD